jgi:branched-chain amino acid transport system substrate-binding protein
VGGDITGKTDAFRAALRKADFPSVRGKFRFANNQHPVQDWYLLRIEPDAAGKLAYRTIKPIARDHGDPHARDCRL